MITSAWSFPRRPICPMRTQSRNDEDLIAAAHYGDAARSGPARSLRVAQEDDYKALALAGTLDDLARAAQVIASASWAAPCWKSSVAGGTLGARRSETGCANSARQNKSGRRCSGVRSTASGALDSDDAKAAIGRTASGQRPRPGLGRKGDPKALVSAIKRDGSPPKDGDVEGWKISPPYSPTRCAKGKTHARWDAFARSVGRDPDGGQPEHGDRVLPKLLAACDAAGLRRNRCRRLLRRRST